MKHSVRRILRVTFLPFTHSIYTLITHKIKRGYSERKTLDRFLQHNTPIFQRESYSSLVRNHCNIFSFSPPSCHTLTRYLYPNTTHTFSKYRECFEAWEALRICQKKPVRLGGCNRVYCGSGNTLFPSGQLDSLQPLSTQGEVLVFGRCSVIVVWCSVIVCFSELALLFALQSQCCLSEVNVIISMEITYRLFSSLCLYLANV